MSTVHQKTKACGRAETMYTAAYENWRKQLGDTHNLTQKRISSSGATVPQMLAFSTLLLLRLSTPATGHRLRTACPRAHLRLGFTGFNELTFRFQVTGIDSESPSSQGQCVCARQIVRKKQQVIGIVCEIFIEVLGISPPLHLSHHQLRTGLQPVPRNCF